VELFIGCYDFIDEYIKRVVDLKKSTRKTLSAFNTKFIELIPKFYNPTSLEKSGRIALCDCIYKIIYKVIPRG
jgi:hypothetical protein